VIESDKDNFELVMVGICETYSKEVTKPLMRLYFTALSSYSIKEVNEGISKHLMDTNHGSFFPKPADIVRHLQLSQISTEDKSELAWSQVIREIRTTGSYGTLKLDDKQAMASVKALGSWQQLCGSTETDMTWKKKEFMQIYQTYENTHECMLPSSLPGLVELKTHKKENNNTSSSLQSIVKNIQLKSGH